MSFICIGHRGAKGLVPENTLLSIEKALSLGCKAIEVDVWKIGQELIVFHDHRLERTTSGKGLLLQQSLENLRKLDAGEGQKIPLLSEVVDLVRNKAKLYVEIKGPGCVRAISKTIATMAIKPEELHLISFDHQQVAECRDLLKLFPRGIVTRGPIFQFAAYAKVLELSSTTVSVEFANEQLIEEINELGLKSFAYTVNHHDDLQRLYSYGASGVFSDYPDRVFEFLRTKESSS